MKRYTQLIKAMCVLLLLGSLGIDTASAQNPLIRDQFSADPTARVFGDRIYLYPSHDILATPGHGKPGWFCMQDYHVFSSSNLTNWKDWGVILTQQAAPWVDSTSYSMWAPDCVEVGGKYYFYFPANVNEASGKGFGIGVAVSDRPYGPFVPRKRPIEGVHGIDPNVFIDKDGQAYLYWAQGEIYVAKLKTNMVELASAPKVIENLPAKGLKEGPFVFERNGLYYLSYPHVADKTEQLEYAVSTSPMGPFKVTGVIMDASPACWTNHQSIVQYKGQWYLFYHHNDYSPGFDKARSVRADRLFFNADGTIKKVVPTLRGIGVSSADSKIQVDRYSAISHSGVTTGFLDSTQTFKGWQVTLNKPGAFVQYNWVDFASGSLKHVKARVRSKTGGRLSVHLDALTGPIIAQLEVPRSSDWKELTVKMLQSVSKRHNLYITAASKGNIQLDWIQFN